LHKDPTINRISNINHWEETAMFSLKLLLPPQNKSPITANFPYDNKEGVVAETIYPDRKGCIYSNGIYWSARCGDNTILEPGEIVYIERLENITAWVKPISRKN
jgi:membrane protein implicated in regulation of membrane protease activity